MIQMRNSGYLGKKGISQILILMIMGVLAVALPLTTKLVQQSQETRSKATASCSSYSDSGKKRCSGNTLQFCTVNSGRTTYWETLKKCSDIGGTCKESGDSAVCAGGSCSYGGKTIQHGKVGCGLNNDVYKCSDGNYSLSVDCPSGQKCVADSTSARCVSDTVEKVGCISGASSCSVTVNGTKFTRTNGQLMCNTSTKKMYKCDVVTNNMGPGGAACFVYQYPCENGCTNTSSSATCNEKQTGGTKSTGSDCSNGSECVSTKCVGGKCIGFDSECNSFGGTTGCSRGACVLVATIDGGRTKVYKCNGKGDGATCYYDKECSSENCNDSTHKCVSNNPAATCGYNGGTCMTGASGVKVGTPCTVNGNSGSVIVGTCNKAGDICCKTCTPGKENCSCRPSSGVPVTPCESGLTCTNNKCVSSGSYDYTADPYSGGTKATCKNIGGVCGDFSTTPSVGKTCKVGTTTGVIYKDLCGGDTTVRCCAPKSGGSTPNPTAKPTVKPTVKPTTKPTVAPTAKPTTKPTVAPTAAPTSVVGQPQVGFKFAYAGIKANAKCLGNIGALKLIVGNIPNMKSQELTVNATLVSGEVNSKGDQVFQTGLINLDGSKFDKTNTHNYVKAKGYLHARMKFCAVDQSSKVTDNNCNMLLNGTMYSFINYPILPGDVTGSTPGQQDGVINGQDYSYVKTRILSDNGVEACGKEGDLNLDGVVNGPDIQLIKTSLGTRDDD